MNNVKMLATYAGTKDNNNYFKCLIEEINQITKGNIIIENCCFPKKREILFECLQMWNPNESDRNDENSPHYCKDAICIVFPKKTLIEAVNLEESNFKLKTDINKDKWIGFKAPDRLIAFIKYLFDKGYSFNGNNNFKGIKNANSNTPTNSYEKEEMFNTLIKIFTPNNKTIYPGNSESIYRHTKNDSFIVDCVDNAKKKECKVKVKEGKTVLFEAFVNIKKNNPYSIYTDKKFYEKIKTKTKLKTEYHPSWDKKLKICDLSLTDFYLVCTEFKQKFSNEAYDILTVQKRKEKNRSSNWTEDETILAYYLCRTLNYQKMNTNSNEVINMSSLMRTRTANALVLKMSNLLYVDSRGIKGNSHCSNLDKKVVGKYKNNLTELAKRAKLIMDNRKKGIINEINRDISKIKNNKTLTETEKEILTKARVGQGYFRNELLKRDCCCLICGIKETKLLKASHIKSWKDCTNDERIDINNGLLLCSLHDSLFDSHLMTFNKEGKILLSNKIDEHDQEKFNLSCSFKLDMNSKTKQYMLAHNNEFKKRQKK